MPTILLIGSSKTAARIHALMFRQMIIQKKVALVDTIVASQWGLAIAMCFMRAHTRALKGHSAEFAAFVEDALAHDTVRAFVLDHASAIDARLEDEKCDLPCVCSCSRNYETGWWSAMPITFLALTIGTLDAFDYASGRPVKTKTIPAVRGENDDAGGSTLDAARKGASRAEAFGECARASRLTSSRSIAQCATMCDSLFGSSPGKPMIIVDNKHFDAEDKVGVLDQNKKQDE